MAQYKTFLALFIPAVVLRVSGLFVSPLWYDELLSLQRARLPFPDHMAVHVNAWEIVLRLFADPTAIRIPSLLCSLAALWLAWLVMDKLKYTDAQKIAAMIALACMPGLIWMAQDARYYSGIALVFMASLYLALTEHWIGLLAVSALSFFIHPIAPAYIIPAWLINTNKRPLWMLSFWIVAILISASFIDLSSPPSWFPKADTEYIVTQYALAIGAHPANILIGVFMIVFVIVMSLIYFKPEPQIIFGVPVAAILAVTFVVLPVAHYRTLQPSLFGLGILIGSFAPKNYPMSVLLPLVLAFMLMQYDPGTHAGHIEHAADLIRGTWEEGTCIFYADEFSRVSSSIVLEGYPECDTGRAWTISTSPMDDRVPAFVSDGWHFPAIYVYAP